MPAHTFLWHDYETFGRQARHDRPAQFAAIRTDLQLNEIGEPIMLYCKPSNDFLPDPQSCLLTGITPQMCLLKGIPEYAFAAEIEKALSTPNTIGVGYNTIRFDDEFTRFLFWRNLIDPYAREWQNGCGRWDLLDVVRTAHALRPEGIHWPKNADGRPSFRLEDLSGANGLVHDSAHDALSDVRATIALARLIKKQQPKLFEFCFALHKKERVAAEIGLPERRPLLHISGMFPSERGCLGMVWPLAPHPFNRNEVLTWDLCEDPSELIALDVQSIRQRLFSRTEDLPEGIKRLPIKSIHINKSPIVIRNFQTFSQSIQEQWHIEIKNVQDNAKIAATLPDMSVIWQEVYQRPQEATPDVDANLYGGFINHEDRRLLHNLRMLPAEKLAEAKPAFTDPRLSQLLWRYRARNFPFTLNAEEQVQWEKHRAACLYDGMGGATRTIDSLFEEMDKLAETDDEHTQSILSALYDYVESIAPPIS